MPAVMIVGGDSFIGSNLIEPLRRMGFDVARTSRRGGSNGAFQMDMTAPEFWPDIDRRNVAIYAAGTTSLAKCEEDPAAARTVNVDTPCLLAERLAKSGGRLIYFSTDRVFDGETAFPEPAQPFAPTTEYGRQKAEAETEIARILPGSAFLRLTKVVSEHTRLFADWADRLAAGAPIEAFDDMVMAPIHLQDVVTATTKAVAEGFAGVLHLSGDTDISYAATAYRLAAALERPETLVRPTGFAALNIPPRFVPRHSALGMIAAKSFLGENLPLTANVLDKIFSALRRIVLR